MLDFKLGMEFLMLSAGISVVISTLRSLVDVNLGRKHPRLAIVYARAMPLAPLVLGCVCGWFVFSPDVLGLAQGLLAGALSGHSYKVIRQTLLARL